MMNKNAMDVKLVERVCRGDREAMDFLANFWSRYCHGIDDIIDREPVAQNPEFVLEVFARAIELYSHPFYLKHLAALKQVALNVTAMYADTVAWEKAADWRAAWADLHRHCSIEMVVAVATACGGYAHARAVIPEVRMVAYAEHHDREGKGK